MNIYYIPSTTHNDSILDKMIIVNELIIDKPSDYSKFYPYKSKNRIITQGDPSNGNIVDIHACGDGGSGYKRVGKYRAFYTEWWLGSTIEKPCPNSFYLQGWRTDILDSLGLSYCITPRNKLSVKDVIKYCVLRNIQYPCVVRSCEFLYKVSTGDIIYLKMIEESDKKQPNNSFSIIADTLSEIKSDLVMIEDRLYYDHELDPDMIDHIKNLCKTKKVWNVNIYVLPKSTILTMISIPNNPFDIDMDEMP